jgi:hypothetical protein
MREGSLRKCAGEDVLRRGSAEWGLLPVGEKSRLLVPGDIEEAAGLCPICGKGCLPLAMAGRDSAGLRGE